MRNVILCITFCLLASRIYSQNIQTHRVPFETNDGIYGYATLQAKPVTFGKTGYIVIKGNELVFEGVRSGTPEGISFPLNAQKFAFDLTGSGCMKLNPAIPDCGNFKMNSVTRTSDNAQVHFNQDARDLHNKMREDSKEGVWQTAGYVQDLKITNVYRDDIEKIRRAMRSGKPGNSGGSGNSSSSSNSSGNSGSVSYNPSSSSSGSSGSSPTREELMQRQSSQNQNAQKSSADKEREREEFHKQHVEKNNSRYKQQQQENQAAAQQQKIAQQQEQERAIQEIQARERQKEAERQRNAQRYNEMKRQSEKNLNSAGELGMASIFVHLLIGKMLYEIKNYDATGIYKDKASMTNINFGYGLSMHSIYANVLSTKSSGATSRYTDIMTAPTIDLNFGMEHWGLYSKYLGLGVNVNGAIGHGLLFENFKWSTQAGIRTFLGPVAYNYKLGYVAQNYNSWIDATKETEEKVRMFTNRHEIGLTFPISSNRLDILYISQNDFLSEWDPAERKFTSDMGVRIEYAGSNQLRFYVDYVELNNAYGRRRSALSADSQDKTPFQLQLGVLKNLNWYGNSFDNNYDRRVLYDALKKRNTWQAGINSKLLGGDLIIHESQAASDTFRRINNNAVFQFQVQKDQYLFTDLFANFGFGMSYLRGFSGRRTASAKTANHPLSRSSSFSYAAWTLDLPFGLRYYPRPAAKSSIPYWLAANAEFVLPIYNMIEPSSIKNEGREDFDKNIREEINSQFKGSYFVYRIGAGIDHYYNLNGKLRWGLFYEFTPTSITHSHSPVIFKPHGLVFSVFTTI